MALCGALFCDILGELKERNIYEVTDRILLFLDLDDLKNVYITSKAWRVAALITRHKTLLNKGGTFSFNVDQLALWKKVRLHLEHNFHVPAEDPLYHLRLSNSIQLGFQHLRNGIWPNPGMMTLDYVPFDFSACPKFYPRCHFEVNEKFIVAWDPASGKLKYWSRRSLSPLNMPKGLDAVSYPTEVGNVGINCRLSGNNIVMGFIGDKDNEYIDNTDLLLLDLVSQCEGGGPTKEPVVVPISLLARLPPQDGADPLVGLTIIHQLEMVGDLVMAVFTVCNFESVQGPDDRKHFKNFMGIFSELSRIQERLQEEPAENPFVAFQHRLEIPFLRALSIDNYYRFLDKDCAVINWSFDRKSRSFGFRTFSLHPPQGGGSVELRQIAEFEVKDTVIIDYANGILAAGSKKADVTLVDVKTGLVRCVFLAHNDFSYQGTLLRMSRDHLVVSWTGVPHIDPGMTFKVWDLKAILESPEPVFVKPICLMKTFAGKLVDFKVDELGIVAVMEHGMAELGIQVLNFLPMCNNCKRMMKPALLKKCVRCKLAAYCGKDCQKADWNPHHKAICSKVDPRGVMENTQTTIFPKTGGGFLMVQSTTPGDIPFSLDAL